MGADYTYAYRQKWVGDIFKMEPRSYKNTRSWSNGGNGRLFRAKQNLEKW